MIFVFAEGGTGSVYFSTRVNVAVRPDTVWGFNPPLKNSYLHSMHTTGIPKDAFFKRSGVHLNYDQNIEENLVRMLQWREDQEKHTMLSGRCSQRGMFLTDNNIKAVCFVRHPLHSFVSFLGSRHPEHAKRFGGFNTMAAVLFYAKLWNSMVTDFIKSGNVVYRFEYMPEEIEIPWLQKALQGWDNSKRNLGRLGYEREIRLKQLVADNYYKLYDHWRF